MGVGFQGGFADWLDAGAEAYLSFEDSLSSSLMISGRGVKLFAKFRLWSLDSVFHIAVMPSFAYASGTNEEENINENPLSFEAASGKLYSLGGVWELVLPMSYRLSPVANLTFAPKMFWIRRSVAFGYGNINEPRISYSRSETQYERIPSVSFGVEIGEKGRRIHPESTVLFDDGEVKVFFGVALKF
jgi:hypothetical protein